MSNSKNERNDKLNEKSKTSVFNRLGSSRPNSDKAEICPNISKNSSCKNESNCKYYHPKSDFEAYRKAKNDDFDRKSRKEDSKIKSAVIVSGRSTEDKYKNDEKTDKSKLTNSSRHRQRSRSHSRSKTMKNTDTRKSENQGSKNMLDMDHTDQLIKAEISSKSDNRAFVNSKNEGSKKDENLKKKLPRNKSRSRDDRVDKRVEKKKESTTRKRRHSSNSTDSSSSAWSSSEGSSRSTSSNSSSNASRSSYEKKKNYKKRKEDEKTSNDGHLKKLSTKPASDKLFDKLQPIPTSKSSINTSRKEANLKKEDFTKSVESSRDSRSFKVVEKEVQKLEKIKIEKPIVDSNKVKPLLSQEILASRTDKVINVILEPKNEKKVEERKTTQKTSKPLESKSSRDIKPESKSVKSPISKNIDQKEEKTDEMSIKKDLGVLVKSKGESKIVLKMLKPLNKMKKDVNTLAEKRNEPIKKSDVSKIKSGDSSKPSLMKLKLEDPKNQSPMKIETDDKYVKREDIYNNKLDDENDNKRRSDKLTRNEDPRVYDEQKIESSTRHSYGESEWVNKEVPKRRVSPEFYSNKYSDSKRSRLAKYEHEHSNERSTERDLGPPTLHHYSPQRSSSPRSRSHKRDRIDGDRHSDPDNVSRSSQHQYEDRYDSIRKLDVGMRRSVSGQRWDLARASNITRIGEGDERYYEKQRISGGYEQRAYRDASYDRSHERIYERELTREHWNRSYERRHDEKGDLSNKEIWDDNYRRSDAYKSRSDWEKRHHDTGPSDEYRNRRDMLLPPPPRIRSSSNLPLEHSNHIDNQAFPDQDSSLDRSRGRAVEPAVAPKEEDVNDVNDILGAVDPKEDLELDFESLPSRIPIVDMLEIKWKSLATGGGCQVVSSSTSIIKRWQPTTILSKIGISRQFAGEELFERVKELCQKELESENENEKNINCVNKSSFNKFDFLSDIAFLHSNALKRKINRDKVVSDIGPCRRALSARTDLNIRRFLCKLDKEELLMFPVQMVDQDLHKQSLQMFLQS